MSDDARMTRLLALPADELEGLREVALLELRARFGQFVPAQLVDRRAAELLDQEDSPRDRYH